MLKSTQLPIPNGREISEMSLIALRFKNGPLALPT